MQGCSHIHIFIQPYNLSAIADDDFTSGSVTLNLPANEMVVCTDIDITDDFLAMEGDERFMVEITVDDPDVVPGPPSTVTITDNDCK